MNWLGSAVAAALMLGMAAVPAAAQTDVQAARDAFRDDIHAAAGLTCEACHRGNTATYAIARRAIAERCATCHSDAEYMREFDPQIRVDQYSQYLTSTHGKQMSTGETRVATCSDCHGAHGIRKVTDTKSPVARINVADTCAKCHADSERMDAFDLPSTIFDDWSHSVHAAALLEKGDLSAPTCSSCHGGHGAAPPGVTDVANVCGTCHVREAELFRASPKEAIFVEDLAQAECLPCHESHRIVHPTDDWIGMAPPALCEECHSDSMEGAESIVAVRKGLDDLAAAMNGGNTILSEAERAGMLVDAGRAALREARDAQIQSRVLVHTFATKPLQDMADQGLEAARTAQTVGEDALHELQVRRLGLFGATILILGFLVTLGIKIRRLGRRTDRSA